MNLSNLVILAGVEQNSLRSRRLTRVDVCHNPYIPVIL